MRVSSGGSEREIVTLTRGREWECKLIIDFPA